MTTAPVREKWDPAPFIHRLEWLAPEEWSIPSDPDEATAEGERTRKTPTQESAARARLAALRRGLGKQPGEVPEVLPVLIPMLGPQQLEPHDRDVAFLIGPLFASYPRPYRDNDLPKYRRNLGGSLWALQQAVDSDGDEESPTSTPAETASESEKEAARSALTPIERRFVALLDSPYRDLAEQLRSIVKLLARKDIPINWVRLTEDLCRWESPNRSVQLAWSMAFWREERVERPESEAEPDEDESDE